VSRVGDAPSGAAVFQASGENDAYDAGRLEQELEAARAGARGVIIDLRRATFVDSTFVSVLLVQAKVREQRLAVVVPGDPANAVARLFDLAHLSEALPVYGDWNEALAAVAQ
jgi:anti-anti-sigma factor